MIIPILQVGKMRTIVAKWVRRECRSRKGIGLRFRPWFRLHPNWLCDFVQIFNFFCVSSLSGGGRTGSMTQTIFFHPCLLVLAPPHGLLQDHSWGRNNANIYLLSPKRSSEQLPRMALQAYPCTCPKLYNKIQSFCT